MKGIEFFIFNYNKKININNNFLVILNGSGSCKHIILYFYKNLNFFL